MHHQHRDFARRVRLEHVNPGKLFDLSRMQQALGRLVEGLKSRVVQSIGQRRSDIAFQGNVAIVDNNVCRL